MGCCCLPLGSVQVLEGWVLIDTTPLLPTPKNHFSRTRAKNSPKEKYWGAHRTPGSSPIFARCSSKSKRMYYYELWFLYILWTHLICITVFNGLIVFSSLEKLHGMHEIPISRLGTCIVEQRRNVFFKGLEQNKISLAPSAPTAGGPSLI